MFTESATSDGQPSYLRMHRHPFRGLRLDRREGKYRGGLAGRRHSTVEGVHQATFTIYGGPHLVEYPGAGHQRMAVTRALHVDAPLQATHAGLLVRRHGREGLRGHHPPLRFEGLRIGLRQCGTGLEVEISVVRAAQTHPNKNKTKKQTEKHNVSVLHRPRSSRAIPYLPAII